MNRASPRPRWAALAIATAAGLSTSSSRAQTPPANDPGTIYFGQQTQREQPNFWVAPIHGELDLRATYNRASTSSAGGSSNLHETLFEEQLTLYTHGYVIHPNLVDFHISVTGGLNQTFVGDDHGSANGLGTLYGWDISATIMRNQPAPVTLYSRRTDSTFNVPFGPTESVTTTTTGALVTYSTVESYAQLEAYHQEQTQSTFGSDNTTYAQTSDVFKGTGNSQISNNQSLNWNFDLENSSYDYGTGSSNQPSAGGSATHTATFGEGYRNSLTSGLSYSQVGGDFPTDNLRWNEHLHISHTPDFETNYDYTYQQLTYGNNTTQSQAAYVDARYQLYKSLTTIGRLRWEEASDSDVSTQTYSADLNLNYRKEVPSGMLFGDANVGRQQEYINGSGSLVVAQEPIAFVGIDPVTVTQQNAIPASVLIRDVVSGRTYTAGTDYTVTPTGQGLQIDRVLGGNILAGRPLLLSYDYDSLNANEVTTNIYGTGWRYQFTKGPLAGLTPFARFAAQDQSVTGGTAQSNQVRDYTVGTSYQYKDLTITGQREWYKSTLYPYESWRGDARLNHRVADDTTLTAGVAINDTQYHDPEQHARSYAVSAGVSRQITTRLSISVYGAYADVKSDIGGETRGMEEGVEANWIYRDTKVYMRLRNATLNSNTADQNYQFFQVGLTRKF